MHVHAGIEDDELRIDLMNQVSYFLPHLLALIDQLALLAGPGHRAQVVPPHPLRRPAAHRHRPSSSRATASGSACWRDLAETGVCDDADQDLVGHPALGQAPDAGACGSPTSAPASRTRSRIAALYQALLRRLWRLRARNQTWRLYRPILIEENKWRAQRFGIEGELADFGRRSLKPFADAARGADRPGRARRPSLGCLAEVERARGIVTRGTSADRQLAVYKAALTAGANEDEARRQVVDWLIEATLAGPGRLRSGHQSRGSLDWRSHGSGERAAKRGRRSHGAPRAAPLLGIEEEYLLVDPRQPRPGPRRRTGFHAGLPRTALGERVTYELLQAQVEVGTPVCAGHRRRPARAR